MSLQNIVNKFANNQLNNVLIDNNTQKIWLKNLIVSSKTFVAAWQFNKLNKNFLFILNDKESAAYQYDDFVNVVGEKHVLFFPSSFKTTVTKGLSNKIDASNLLLRTEVLNKISNSTDNYIIVTYPAALVEKVISQTNLVTNTLQLGVGENVSIEFIKEMLHEYNFVRVDFVFEPGQYSIRGSIIDIFSFSYDYPYRIDFFGDEVDSIRTFNITTQLSISKFDKISIIPDVQTIKTGESINFLDFIPKTTILWLLETQYLIERVDMLYEQSDKLVIEENGIEKTFNMVSGKDLADKLPDFKTIELSNKTFFKTSLNLEFNISPQPIFNKNFNLLAENLNNHKIDGYTNFILSENEKQFERLDEIFKSEFVNQQVEYLPIKSIVHEGFISNDLKICVYTDHQIFDRYHKFKLKEQAQTSSKEALTIKEINDLKPGDYVVHVDHGIGIFGGLETQEMNGKKQEVIRLVYQDKDILYVSIHSLHRIAKYKGAEGTPPKVYKLGSPAWGNLKKKTKSNVKDIAEKLIALYAKRLQEKGYAFSHDTYLQQAREASFIYEDTPDQYKATQDVKADMESLIPMDRLVCGDVGFGKTEVAIRAAFKAVADSKQVAILVPTTILALQHYKTFSDRLKDFPAKVAFISRMKSVKEQNQILKELEEGKIDIIIGTHRVVSKDVKFKDLGLLVIDEEQKFGVGVKDKLKEFKVNVDTLTLTATPIPRTLQFSLMGARDLSIIQTPPPNRYPIITEVHTHNEEVIKQAINYEIQRNGQVFFINNRIQNIVEIEQMIIRLCPAAKPIIAHGQMDGKKLEKIMLDFISEEYNVLIATTIVESGLDIPNANTIIINNAQNFGLSDLHQLRGRVGRSNKKAFCYLIAPPQTVLTTEARQRLKALENFAELGSGFNIALQDLDIRGAGNMLGGEQSGFISDIGIETYKRILEEAMFELRENEYKEFFKNQEENESQEKEEISIIDKNIKNQAREIKKNIFSESRSTIKFVNDCQIDTDLEILFPETYIENNAERLKLYRDLDCIENQKELDELELHLIDRFGKLPKQSIDLLNVVKLRWRAIELAIEKIALKQSKMVCYFVTNQDSAFYDSPLFHKTIMTFVHKNPKLCNLKQINTKLTLSFENIKTVSKAIEMLGKIV